MGYTQFQNFLCIFCYGEQEKNRFFVLHFEFSNPIHIATHAHKELYKKKKLKQKNEVFIISLKMHIFVYYLY